jgi:hypothetical protein
MSKSPEAEEVVRLAMLHADPEGVLFFSSRWKYPRHNRRALALTQAA